jgi:hypothetical protein
MAPRKLDDAIILYRLLSFLYLTSIEPRGFFSKLRSYVILIELGKSLARIE